MITYLKQTKLYKNYKKNRVVSKVKKWTEEDNDRLKLYSSFLTSGDLCFDIGANLGNRTKIFAKIVGSSGCVVSVEPQPYCMGILERAFCGLSQVTLEEKAIGDVPGRANMYISNENTLSSLSDAWINSVKSSKRFGDDTRWDRTIDVQVITLDSLIEKYGVPAFIKVDVEGFEREVVAGLTRQISTCISLEFTPEYMDSTFFCLDHLASIGEIVCNYSLGESMELLLPKWVKKDQIIKELHQYSNNFKVFGDLYVTIDGNA